MEKVALYAKDMLLFLGYLAGSLESTISLIESFGRLSGFSINWDKSVPLPVDF